MRKILANKQSALLLSLPMAALAAALAYVAWRAPAIYENIREDRPDYAKAVDAAGGRQLVAIIRIGAGVGAAVLLAGAGLSWLRRPWALPLLRKSFLLVYLLTLAYAYLIFRGTEAVLAPPTNPNDSGADVVDVFCWRWSFLWPGCMFFLAAAFVHILSLRRKAMNYATRGDDRTAATGDRILENLRTHGRDPRYRKSMAASIGAHVLVIIIIPWLLDMYGCVENYRVPFGSGTPTVMQMQIVRKKPKEKKKYILRPNSVISFHVPDLDESEISKEVNEATQLTYTADTNAMAGRMGAGGGKTGGWPAGMKDGKVRFIRLQYDGSGWDDGMDGVSRADINFLEEFRRLTGFAIARQGESHPIRYLEKYDKGFAPPFIYMTGDKSINVSARDREVLRRYLQEGGLLFADCGGRAWDASFRTFIQQVLPDQRLLVISDDDPIFQIPYRFSNGAPPLWHHGGMRALGMKIKDRWVVFYHPGDVNDAWKTGSSGMEPELAKGAFQMGVNIVYYAFTHYLEVTRKYRK